MSTITITSPARCKDCRFLQCKAGRYKNGNVKIWYVCGNDESPRAGQPIGKRDLVCDKWQM